MAEGEAIKLVVIQVAIQATTAAVMLMTEADAMPVSGANTANPREVYRQRHGGAALEKLSLKKECSRQVCRIT